MQPEGEGAPMDGANEAAGIASGGPPGFLFRASCAWLAVQPPGAVSGDQVEPGVQPELRGLRNQGLLVARCGRREKAEARDGISQWEEDEGYPCIRI